jgi:hypothetical protein
MNWGLLIGGLALIGGIGVVFAPRVPGQEEEPTAREAPANEPGAAPGTSDPNDLGIANPKAVSPMDLLGAAKARALAWDPEAILVSITAEPTVGGRVDLTAGGRIAFVFGRPTGQGFGAGAAVKPRAFSVDVGHGATLAHEVTARQTRAAAEPNCTPEEATGKLRVAGDARVDLLYAFSSRHDRVTWRAKVAGETTPRWIDGWTCTILVR